MQQLTKAALAVHGLLICGTLLTACQTENGIAPQQPIPSTTEANPTVINAAQYARIRHNLVKHGSNKLEYTSDGRLAKVINSATEYTDYAYSPAGTILATHFKFGQQTGQITYKLNADGRCTESKHVSSLENKTYLYEYNAQGRLTKRYNQNAVNERFEFEYDANGELAVFRTFDSGNIKGVEILFGYSVPNEAVELDRYRLNSSFLYPMDEYLTIFGAFNKNLVRRITYKACGANDVVEYLLNYKLNADGLVVEKNLFNLVTNTLTAKTTSYYSGYGLIIPN